MPKDRLLVNVPDYLKEPLKFDLWRLRIDPDNNLILDFAKKDKTTDNHGNLIASLLIDKNEADNFVMEFLYRLYFFNKEYNLGIQLFNDNKKKEE